MAPLSRKAMHHKRRTATDPATREQWRLLIDQDKNGVPDRYISRQLRLVNRVRVQARRS